MTSGLQLPGFGSALVADPKLYRSIVGALHSLQGCQKDLEGLNLDDKRSTAGFCIYLGSNLIAWHSKKQYTISRSSTEAEYRNLANLVLELTWIQSLLTKLRIHVPKSPVIWCDNLSIVKLAANPILHARTKHMKLDLYFVRERVLQKQVEVRHVPPLD
ncbi:Retrovirus-related Pol polyprotein from transposon RE2 [Vitis vinifera]|uniref:Retrovirus-related Pol polyprotein from transposon RE2 n=1 Tax=Vitis vinifera TaxID=29760 RepID=A0A438C2C4_VITVI|nr:Retrovirus-related Pol polyprotein from transposon RE2 [Vitis vinifera]